MYRKHLMLLLLTLLWLPAAMVSADADAVADAARADHEATLQEAESARREALALAEEARELAQRQNELARREAEREREHSEEKRRQHAIEQEELAQVREELSRAHRELREASREVARAHRELGRAAERQELVRYINLGDRAVIGVILGQETSEGIEIIGLSPDGPAEQAGLQQGDVLTSMRGIDLGTTEDGRPGQSVQQIMKDVGDGEELAISVLRNGERWDYMVTAEKREPGSWQSIVSLPEVAGVAMAPDAPHIVVERIEVPEIDEEALAHQIAEISEQVKRLEFHISIPDGADFDSDEDYHFEITDMSRLGEHALREADVWFGLPQAQGLELTELNSGLGEYFKTDHGVLVIKAREDNAYTLESGDVVLEIAGKPVDKPADMMRALREIEPGTEIEIRIMRNRKSKTLKMTMPENRLGQSFEYRFDYDHDSHIEITHPTHAPEVGTVD